MADSRLNNLAAREQAQTRKPRPQYCQGRYRSTAPATTPTMAPTGSVRVGRVEKSLSRGSSPRTVDRRRHTTSTRPRPRMIMDGSSSATKMAGGSGYDDDEPMPTASLQTDDSLQRPLSWHPSTSLFPVGQATGIYPATTVYTKDGLVSGGYDYGSFYSPNQVNQDYTASTWAQAESSMISSIQMAAELQHHPVMYIPSHDGSVISCGQNWAHQDMGMVNYSGYGAAATSQASADHHFHSLPSSLSNPGFQYPTAYSSSTQVESVAAGANASPILFLSRSGLKIDTEDMVDQNSEEAWGDEDNDSPTTPGDGDVLIGMGLYDRPSDSASLFSSFENGQGQNQFSSLFTSSSSPSASTYGKGLKLEEEWQPPPRCEGEENEEDDEGDEEDLEGDDEDSENNHEGEKKEPTLKPDEANLDGEGDEDFNTQNADIYSHAASPADPSLNYSDLVLVRNGGEYDNLALFSSDPTVQHYYNYERCNNKPPPTSNMTEYGYGHSGNVANPRVVYVARPTDELQSHYHHAQDHQHQHQHHDSMIYGGHHSSPQWEVGSTYAW